MLFLQQNNQNKKENATKITLINKCKSNLLLLLIYIINKFNNLEKYLMTYYVYKNKNIFFIILILIF